MLKTYIEKRDSIKEEILSIGNTVVDALEVSLKKIKNDDVSSLKEIDLSVKKLSNKSNEIDNLIVTTLALYSPEAKDLREMVSYLKITNELIRAVSNVKGFIKIFRKAYSDELNTATILEYAIPLHKSALLALRSSIAMLDDINDSDMEDKYHRIIVEETKSDDLYAMVEKNILKLISKNLELSKEYFDILSSLRKLDRTADRASSIANLAIFAQVGGDIIRS
ncbi:PhoU family transcriptional regulator [Poseidonibacter lekithochrous]|uniref:phosphate signaling complex PhoU family protein n=1 Tax=Poseidonibacter TaxID=2321187 RepID=UPI001C084DA6|nr:MULTISPECIES: PhoU domain-containing protein [Poseidonibacter]MBU3014445.1 PhoU family transcriptional regulator [Poseidonibacter lekithochrous]MDO6827743.1 PhoU domain-containing protein [Poseidonibacter sp. 1_MG-2023]